MLPGVYILTCSNGRYYMGSTTNISRRLTEHRRGRVKYTKNILPVKLALFHQCPDITTARKLEYKLKKHKSRTLLERIIADGEIKMGL